ncbi:dihydroxyacetone kinase subunit DhaL [Moorellaceae bacterium AZ2]
MPQNSVKVARRACHKILAALEAAEAELNRLDAAAGDGDHGTGMVRGMRAAVIAAEKSAETPGELLEAAGTAFADAAGGASGALFGNLFISVGQALPNGKIDADSLHKALAHGLDTVCTLGCSKPGDKTMIDTLDPFVRAMAEQVAAGKGVVDAWKGALPAAEAGAKSTADMISKRGRASRLGERSRGHVDPGAMSTYYILRAVGEALTEGC